MSSLNIKQGSDTHFPEYPLASPSNNEIDLLNLIEVLWRAKKTVMAVIFAFACTGLLISFILPQKWTSAAVVTPPEPVQWQALEKTFTKLRVLDLDIKIDRTEAFNLFIKKFQSVSLLEEYSELNREKGYTLAAVLHELNQACRYASHLIALR
ncbi:Wzz/FepE/Etk N-terminal domain-containing protein, partial [Escherichia coli]|uniref:Wzz/FepE/Etk N-terminal domain-containing protein n=1 Tax=Escherichia coli TaxID=562 RepID=UPI003F515A61